MNHLIRLLAVAAVFAAIAVFSCLSFASDAPIETILQAPADTVTAVIDAHAVKYQDAAAYVIGLIGAAIGALFSFLTKFLFGAKGKVPLKSEHKATLDSVIQVGVLKATATVQDLIKKAPDIDVKNVLVAEIANFVTANVPTALTALGITPTSLEEYIRHKIDHDDELVVVSSAGISNGNG